MSMSSKALLATFVATQWTARKLDRKVTQEIAEQHHASLDAGRYNKMLLAKNALADIQQIASGARIYHYQVTLPWNLKGTQILPAKMFTKYNEQMNTYKNMFHTAVAKFLLSYPNYIEDAKIRLKDMFDVFDYPNVDDIRNRFSFEVHYSVIPASSDDIRVNLSEKEKKTLKKEIIEEHIKLEDAAVKATMQRMQNVVERMYLSLRKDVRFTSTMISSIDDLVKLIPALNFTDNPEIKKLGDDMKKLCRNDADDLRKDDHLRKDVAKEANEILKKMAGAFS